MRFPESERVIYKVNPLVEVICQVRFPRLLRIERELPVEFQEALRTSYPETTESISARLPEEVVRAIGMDPANLSQRTFEFLNKERTWKIGLTSNFLALSTTAYTRWEDFRTRLDTALDALRSTYAIEAYARVGLRYRDLVCRSRVGLGDRPWVDLLRSEVLGELALDGFLQSVRQAQRQLNLSLDFDDSAVRFSHGLQESDGEACYLFDADFFRETETTREHAAHLLSEFNREAGRLFRWCIQPDLHNAMGPTAP